MLAAAAFLASTLVAAVACAEPVPVSDRFGLCIDVPRGAARIELHAPTDTVFAVLYHERRPLVQFRIDTMPGEALRAAEQAAEIRPGWSSGSFDFYGAVPGQGDLIVVRNDQSELHRNLFITVTHATSLPSWIDVPALERSISHCGKNAVAEPSAPPVLDAPVRP
ncbi:MAG: hypothetical protein ACTHNM_05630 [Dyella sp.]|uniref:hypothetical protein n=1 Tax=Dyella sp. TaxID=1869338 RepID=UPI003F821E50